MNNYDVCIFCRQKIYYQGVCIGCIEGFRDWIISNFKFQNIDVPKNTILFGVGVMLGILSFQKGKKKILLRKKLGIKKWPGFYCGNMNWIVPKIDIIVEEQHISVYNIESILEKKLRNCGIFIYEEIHIYKKQE